MVIVRPFNTYGPRQSARAVIPTIITQLLSGASEIKLGKLTPTRDFTYVRDTVDAFVKLAKSDDAIGEEINIATGEEISIGQLANELVFQLNPAAKIIREPSRLRPEKSEVDRLIGCNKKIMSLTNWKPQHNLSQGLAETISWFKVAGNASKYKGHLYNI